MAHHFEQKHVVALECAVMVLEIAATQVPPSERRQQNIENLKECLELVKQEVEL
jgi:hypothetical protein